MTNKQLTYKSNIFSKRNRAKIIFAINQIRQGMTIKQLAYTLGYHHSSSFIEFFKRYTGQTPIQLKNASI